MATDKFCSGKLWVLVLTWMFVDLQPSQMLFKRKKNTVMALTDPHVLCNSDLDLWNWRPSQDFVTQFLCCGCILLVNHCYQSTGVMGAGYAWFIILFGQMAHVNWHLHEWVPEHCTARCFLFSAISFS